MSNDKEKDKSDGKEGEEPEDTPEVKELKTMDDEYLATVRQFNAAREQLREKYVEIYRPILEERKAILLREGNQAAETNEPPSATPGCPSFWLQALQNFSEVKESIEEYDVPVLRQLKDVRAEWLKQPDSDEPSSENFKLIFEFAENSWFENTEIVRTHKAKPGSPYNGAIELEEIEATEIKWKPGMDVTVELVKPKVKGGGARKAKQKEKVKEVARPSFFRSFFRSVKQGMKIPEDITPDDMVEMSVQDPEDDEEVIGMLLEEAYNVGREMAESFVPFAIHWYTGEAADDDDDEDDEDEESDEEDDDDDDDEDEDEEPAPKKGAAKPKAKKGAKEAKPAEECKQQ